MGFENAQRVNSNTSSSPKIVWDSEKLRYETEGGDELRKELSGADEGEASQNEIVGMIITIGIMIWVIYRFFFGRGGGMTYKDKLKSIPGVGNETADLIIDHYPSEGDLKGANVTDIASEVSGVGIGTAKKIKNKFN